MGAELTPTKDRSKRIAVAFHKVGMRLRLPNVPRLTEGVHQRDRVAALAIGSACGFAKCQGGVSFYKL